MLISTILGRGWRWPVRDDQKTRDPRALPRPWVLHFFRNTDREYDLTWDIKHCLYPATCPFATRWVLRDEINFVETKHLSAYKLTLYLCTWHSPNQHPSSIYLNPIQLDCFVIPVDIKSLTQEAQNPHLKKKYNPCVWYLLIKIPTFVQPISVSIWPAIDFIHGKRRSTCTERQSMHIVCSCIGTKLLWNLASTRLANSHQS